MKFETKKQYMNCTTCARLKMPSQKFCGVWVNGCLEKMSSQGPPDLRHARCGKWLMRELNKDDY